MQQFNVKQVFNASLAIVKGAYQQLIQLKSAVHCLIHKICICGSLKDKYYFLLKK